jgi:hypothetical protein
VGDADRQSLWGEGDQPRRKSTSASAPARARSTRAPSSDHIPPELGAAVASALAFNPAERWPTVRAFALALAHGGHQRLGRDRDGDVRRVARELTIAPGDDSTAGRPMPPPLAPTLEIAIPVTPTRFPPGAVPIVAAPDAVPTQPLIPAHQITPAPGASAPSRADALTVRPSGTLTNAVSVSQATETKPEPIRAARQRRGLFVAAGAAGLVVAVVAVVLATAGDKRSTPPTTATAPPAAPATSAIAIITEPAGAAITIDGATRGTAPVNIAAPVGSEIEIRAELPGHAPAIQRAKVGAEPATVRVALTASTPIDAGTAAASATVDAGRRKRPHSTTTTAPTLDPDGLVQP